MTHSKLIFYVQWDATNDQGKPVSSGVYLYSIKVDDFMQTKKCNSSNNLTLIYIKLVSYQKNHDNN